MFYEAELRFFRNILTQYHLDNYVIDKTTTIFSDIDHGIRQYLGLEEEYSQTARFFRDYVTPNTIYKISDDFFCNYILFQLPDSDTPVYMLIGPYTTKDFTKEDIMRAIEKYHVPPELKERIIQYYGSIPLIADTMGVRTLLNVFASTIWQDPEIYTFKEIQYSLSREYSEPIREHLSQNYTEQKDISFKMQLMENRYAAENRFIKNISQGNYHRAEVSFDSSNLFDIENRVSDPLRNFKNYSIVMNTLLRKAAELGTVHPIHIDKVSSAFAKKIEEIRSLDHGKKLMKEMIRKYGLLVKNYSMKDYSLLVQKVITRIDADLTADQSLKTHAEILNVNPSYLSTLFRKETGTTLTDYVNRKRVEYGIFLLNSTNMQIQLIAQHCGMSDINYFTRIFKKYIGKTPKEYRQELNS